MSDVNTISGYYNLYDSTKGYTELLFRAGKVLQSKEVNEIQSMLKNQIKNVGNTILTNGDIIEGCQLIISDDKTSVTVTDGKIYLDGDVRSVAATTLKITGSGTETIGAIITKKIITPDDDADLLDVSSGYDNYNQDGAYRLKEIVEIVLNNNSASILYNIVDGEQLSANTSEDLTQLDKINATLARRTFDESGNYKVNGLSLSAKGSSDASKIYVSLDPGKAYVKGYEVSKLASSTVGINRASTLRNVENEPKAFSSGTTKYSLNNEYVNAITKIVAIVQVSETVTRGSIVNGIDYLKLSPVVDLVSVVQGSTTYTKDVDYQLSNDGVRWIGSKAPETGTSYTVVYTYNKTMSEKNDYTLSASGDTGYVQFTTTGDKPTNGSTFLVNYNFKLCRRDIISLDKDGNILITEGQPDILRTVDSPSVDEDNSLVLGSVLVKPNSDDITIINNNTKTITMLKLYKMLERIDALEYNQAISDLDNEAAEGEDATELIGVFTDGFIGTTKADITHGEFTASIDLDNQELTLPAKSTVNGLSINKLDGYTGGTFGNLLTSAYTEITLLSQSLATGSLRVNSYNAFPKLPDVKLNPSTDNWVDTSTITIQGTNTSRTVTLRRWWYHKNESWAAEEKALWQSYGYADGGSSLGWNNGLVETTRSIVTSVIDTAITYMRQIKVTVTGSNFAANQDNIVCTFDGKQVSLTPTKTSYKGTASGSLKADSQGVTSGYFTVPANTPCGTKAVNLYASNLPTYVGTTNYTAQGTSRVTTKKVWKETVTLQASDPLAQSFQFETDQFLTGVGVYFKDKDTTEPITVQVRNMVNGYPGTTVYASKVIQPGSINYNESALSETKINFDDPVYCEAGIQYCFTILSNSDHDSVWIAETSEKDISSSTQVTKNPYLNGNLFSSSNALTWTAHQSADMKFNLYGAKFNTSANIVFDKIEDINYDRIMVMAEQSIPSGCSVQWKYAINDGSWLPIEIYDDRDMDEVVQNIKLKVEITANTYTSPAIALDSLILVGFENEDRGVYVSRNVAVTDGYNHVKVVIDLHKPTYTNIEVYYATDTSGTTWNSLKSTNVEQKSADYDTYTFEADLGATAKNYRCKVVLTTTDKTSRPTAMNLRSIMKTL